MVRLVERGVCALCEPARQAEQKRSEAREPARKKWHRLYGYRWQIYSRARLRREPLCVDPDKRHEGRHVAATVTDHIEPHRGNVVLFWDKDNHQSLCDGCHGYKTAHEDGGFG